MAVSIGKTVDGVQAAPARVRDRSVDVLKGLGIVIIMAGHIDYSGVGGAFVTYLYTFNVALFFVVAGYTWRPKPGQSLLASSLIKVRQIYLPYVALFTISLLYGHLIVRYVFGEYVIPFEWKATLKALLFGSEWLNSVPTFNFALWFLPIFLLASLCFGVLQKVTNLWIYAAVVLALVVVSLPFQDLLPGRPIVNINVLPVALALMACGYLLKRFDLMRFVNFPALVALLVATLLIAYFAPGNVSRIGSYLFYLSALAGFVLVLRLAKVMESSRILEFVGRNSLLMFGLHGLIANTYPQTGIADGLFATWSGLMLYLVNLAYVFLVTLTVVALYRTIRTRVDRRRHRARELGASA